MRVGFGYDAHRLVPGRALVIAGVDVPFDRGLAGHSDADVATHAVIDAVLGAAALGDCGTHFPATDSQYEGAKSTALLRSSVAMIAAEGLRVFNVDCTVVAERPALAPFVPAMRAALAAALGIDLAHVSVKAKRPEGLGFAGDGSGIEAHAVALLEER
jgi:2-C-methyl-D-erythritol 2,4-cyclodiphosphate synthase